MTGSTSSGPSSATQGGPGSASVSSCGAGDTGSNAEETPTRSADPRRYPYPRDMTRASAIPLLRNPIFARLWFIQAANQVGGNMALYALTILVFDTTRSNATVSALFATYVVPQIVLSPFAGVVVDRLNLRLSLIHIS